MYANVCALSLFLTCGPYVRLPAWAGENSPECLILLNKRHGEACRVLHGPSPLTARLSSALVFSSPWPRRWFVAGGEVFLLPVAAFWACFCCFRGSFGCQPSGWHCTVSANRGQECYTAWNKRTSTTATCTQTHTEESVSAQADRKRAEWTWEWWTLQIRGVSEPI